MNADPFLPSDNSHWLQFVCSFISICLLRVTSVVFVSFATAFLLHILHSKPASGLTALLLFYFRSKMFVWDWFTGVLGMLGKIHHQL